MLHKFRVCKSPSFFPSLLSDYLRHYTIYINNRLVLTALSLKHVLLTDQRSFQLADFVIFLRSRARNNTGNYISLSLKWFSELTQTALPALSVRRYVLSRHHAFASNFRCLRRRVSSAVTTQIARYVHIQFTLVRMITLSKSLLQRLWFVKHSGLYLE